MGRVDLARVTREAIEERLPMRRHSWARVLTACHEAGHVIATVEHGALCGADLVQRLDEGSNARSFMVSLRHLTPTARAQVALAGTAALQIRRGHGAHPIPWTAYGGQGDIATALDALRYDRAAVARAYASVVRMLRRRWVDVERIADALLDLGSLTDGMVQDVLSGGRLVEEIRTAKRRG